jgi:hypothetical protein
VQQSLGKIHGTIAPSAASSYMSCLPEVAHNSGYPDRLSSHPNGNPTRERYESGAMSGLRLTQIATPCLRVRRR